MHIALRLDALIPPTHYGGTERVIEALARGLVALGHRVTLLARDGSHAEGATVVPVPQNATYESFLPDDVDVLHLRESRVASAKLPYLTTIDGNGTPGETMDPHSVFVSSRHAANHHSTRFVHNGIDPGDYTSCDVRADFALFLANARWDVKNLRGAIQVARKARVPLEVIGDRGWPLGLDRFLPRLRGVRYHGSLDEEAKRRLLSRARALLFPVRWDEPFGLAVTEALASGCPVLATPYGALPEIVTPEVGVLSSRGADLVEALRRADGFDPKACRRRVHEGFTHLDMARGYLRHYESLAARGRPADEMAETPRTRDGFRYGGVHLLPWTPP